MNNLNFKNMFYVAALLAVCLALYGFSFNASLVNTQYVDLSDIHTVNIAYISDRVTFYESETNELVLKEYMNRNNPDFFARISTSGKTLNIEHGRRPWFSWLISDVEIYLPKSYQGVLVTATVSGGIVSNIDFNVERLNIVSTSGSIDLKYVNADVANLKTTSGRIHTGDISANSEIKTTSGKIEISNILGNSSVVSTSARIQVDGIQGNSFVKSTSGSILIGNLLGAKQDISTTSGTITIDGIHAEMIKIKSTSGKIDIGRVFGKLSANSTSGKITIAKAGGAANLSTVSGSVQANYGFVDGDIFIKTTSGKVMLSIPDDISFYFDASTASGSIRTTFNDGNMSSFKSVSRQVGNVPESSIEISTVSGPIELNTRPAMNKKVRELPQIL